METKAVRFYGDTLSLDTFEFPAIQDDEIFARVVTDTLCLSTYKAVKQGTVTIAHDIMDAVYFILRDGVEYLELGANYFDQLQHDQLVKFHTKHLRDLGIEVQTGVVAVAA